MRFIQDIAPVLLIVIGLETFRFVIVSFLDTIKNKTVNSYESNDDLVLWFRLKNSFHGNSLVNMQGLNV